MIIRAETPADYAAIAELNYRAFDQRTAEPLVVTLARHARRFDPSLSLVAEQDGQIVGHVLFHPHTIRLMDQDVRGVCLAPLAVDPPVQKRGIGGTLIEEGHRIARERGFGLSFLLGHDTYYPRFGYQTHAFGASSVTVTVEDDRGEPLTQRPPTPNDLPALVELWEHEERRVDMATRPDGAIFDWISPNPLVQAYVYERNGELVGYTRGKVGQSPIAFYALDHDAARRMAAQLATPDTRITLPLHPYSASAGAFEPQPEAAAWGAGMVCALVSSPFDEYMERLKRGERAPGRPIWGTAFDVA